MISKNLALVAIISLMLLGQNAQAQFQKYKSRTKINRPGDQGDIPKNPNNDQGVTLDEEEASPDLFGRNAGLQANFEGPKAVDSKYVNLNPETAFGPEVITSFDFPDSTLLELTKHMQKLTGLNIIIDKDLKGKVSIMAPSPITVGDAWKAYLTALNMNNYTLVKTGAFYQIVNSRDVRYTPTKIYTGTFTPDTESYIMRIIPLKHIDGTEISRSFRPFMSRYGRIIDIQQTNTIIVHDTGSNINRLLKLIKFLDVTGFDESLQIIKVKHSSAQEIAKLLDTILKTQSSSSRRKSTKDNERISKIIAEPRTNTIIAMATDQGAKELRQLINKLDVPIASTGNDRVHVYYLNYGDAEDLEKTLSSIVSANASSGSSSRRSSRITSRTSNNDSGDSLFSDNVKIKADATNNALVVTASPTDWLTVKNVLSKLDIPRNQVYVEGMIMETTIGNAKNLGVSWFGAHGTGQAQRAGFGASNIVNLLSNQLGSLGGLFAGAGFGSEIEVEGIPGTVNSVNALIQAVASDNRTNVLATPQILTLDNVEGIFEVGESVPISTTTNTSNGSSQTSVTDKNILLTLKIKPQINKVTRFIKLDINFQVDDFSQREVQNVGGGVGTTKRSADTEVLVRDRDTIAMGGLMRDQDNVRVNQVPLLSDIPILGWLFKSKTTVKEKRNLMFFLTPKILAPYEKMAGQNTKELLNRRNAHLEKAIGDDDPHLTTTKALYHKANKQIQDPLYNKEDAQKFIDENEGQGIGAKSLGGLDAVEDDVPNYGEIAKKKKELSIQDKSKKTSTADNKLTPSEELLLEDIDVDEIIPVDINVENIAAPGEL